MKRFAEIVLALMILPFATPLVLACVAAIRLTSVGPAIFRQTRVGLNEKLFTCYKLRTMYIETPDAPSHETAASSVTPIGTWLRRLKLDELPQLWNILRGDMSFVGPRPCLPSQVELIEARRVRGLNAIRPGVTGVSQVAGIDMSDPQRLAESDAAYLADMSLMTDIKLVAATALGAGQGDRVRSERISPTDRAVALNGERPDRRRSYAGFAPKSSGTDETEYERSCYSVGPEDNAERRS